MKYKLSRYWNFIVFMLIKFLVRRIWDCTGMNNDFIKDIRCHVRYADNFLSADFDLLKPYKWWVRHDARWYQFWYPQSGFPGGLIFAVLISNAIVISLITTF